MKKVSKREFYQIMAVSCSLDKNDAKLLTDNLGGIIANHIAQCNSIQLRGFGVFKPYYRYDVLQPLAKEKMIKPRIFVCNFKCSKMVKLNKD